MSGGHRSGLRLWIISGSLACVAVLLAIVFVVFPAIRTPQQVAADAAPPRPSPMTATADKRALSGSVILRAVVVPGASIKLTPSDALIAANPVVTSLPAAGAATVEPGTVLIEANGEPVIAMNWPFPAYRDIHGGDTGPDVVQLQNTLISLGYPTGNTGQFDARTRLGVSELYAGRGYTAPMAAATSLGTGTTDNTGGSNASKAQKTTTADQTGSQQVYLPARDVQAIPAASSRLTSIPLHVGQKLSAPDLVVAELDGKASTLIATTTADRAGRIAAGNTGTLTAGPQTKQYTVKVTSVASSVDDVPGLGQGIRVDLEFADPTTAPPVSAKDATSKLEIMTNADNVVGIVLPITAIYSTQDGASYVVPASDPNAHIKVELGATIDGWVEIKPESTLKEGEDVVLGMRQTG